MIYKFNMKLNKFKQLSTLKILGLNRHTKCMRIFTFKMIYITICINIETVYKL